jgi:branched-chain amino acid transport system permease protein
MDPLSAFFLGVLDGLTEGLLFALVAIGFTLSYGILRIVNLTHGEFYMIGAVMTWVLYEAAKNPLYSLIIAPLFSAFLAVIIERTVLSRIKYAPEPTIIATAGLLYIIQQSTLMVIGPYSRSVPPPLSTVISTPWFGYSSYKIAVALASIMIAATLWILFKRTNLGLRMRCVQQDAELAKNFGINVRKIYSLGFGLSAALAAAAGVLIVPIRQAHYLMGFDALLMSLLAVTIGGMGSLRGTFLASVMIGLFGGIVAVFTSPTTSRILSIMLVVVVVIFKPHGILECVKK